jgi:DnaJ domain
MGEATALKLAIDLLHVPSQVRQIRSEPLPQGVFLLLRIAAADGDAEVEAAKLIGRSPETIRRAAAFFIEQVLLCPEADSYRILGGHPDTTSAELRRNMALLLRWLHPDMDQRGERSVFAARVTRAWQDLKTPERRNAYDLEHRALSARNSYRWNGGTALAQPGRPGVNPRSRSSVPSKNGTRLAQFLASRTIEPHDRLYRALLRLLGGYRH